MSLGPDDFRGRLDSVGAPDVRGRLDELIFPDSCNEDCVRSGFPKGGPVSEVELGRRDFKVNEGRSGLELLSPERRPV